MQIKWFSVLHVALQAGKTQGQADGWQAASNGSAASTKPTTKEAKDKTSWYKTSWYKRKEAATSAEEVPPKRVKVEPDQSKVKCFRCKQFGHKISDCPQPE